MNVKVTRSVTLELSDEEFTDLKNAIAAGICKHAHLEDPSRYDFFLDQVAYVRRWHELWSKLEAVS